MSRRPFARVRWSWLPSLFLSAAFIACGVDPSSTESTSDASTGIDATEPSSSGDPPRRDAEVADAAHDQDAHTQADASVAADAQPGAPGDAASPNDARPMPAADAGADGGPSAPGEPPYEKQNLFIVVSPYGPRRLAGLPEPWLTGSGADATAGSVLMPLWTEPSLTVVTGIRLMHRAPTATVAVPEAHAAALLTGSVTGGTGTRQTPAVTGPSLDWALNQGRPLVAFAASQPGMFNPLWHPSGNGGFESPILNSDPRRSWMDMVTLLGSGATTPPPQPTSALSSRAETRQRVRAYLDQAVFLLRYQDRPRPVPTAVLTFGMLTYPATGLGDQESITSAYYDHGTRTQADSVRAVNEEWRQQAEEVAYLTRKLRETRVSGGRTLLDHTLVLWVGWMGVGQVNSDRDVPVVLIGGTRFRAVPGKVLALPERTHQDLLRTIANALGRPVSAFGDPGFNHGPIQRLLLPAPPAL